MAHSTGTPEPTLKQGLAAGTSIGAGVLMLVIGALSILEGISAASSDDLLVVGTNDYIYKFNTHAWGWIHIVVGILVIITAYGLMTGTTWGRVGAMIMAALSIVANFLWMPYYPAWSLLIIALDALVIWAIATWKPTTA